jgi:two-component system, OmpR family, sensor histidine kinase BaeS
MSNTTSDSSKLMALAVHELRTPVSVVAGYVRLLQRHFGASMTDQQRSILKNCEESCNGLASLLKDLSDLANFEAGRSPLRRAMVELGALVRAAADGVVEGRDRGVTLEVAPQDLPVHISADPERLRVALATLYGAALRERADSGAVVVRWRTEGSPDGDVAKVAIGDVHGLDDGARPESGRTDEFDEYRGGLGFSYVMATRVIAAHGGSVSAPNASRGRLSLLVSLPLGAISEDPR